MTLCPNPATANEEAAAVTGTTSGVDVAGGVSVGTAATVGAGEEVEVEGPRVRLVNHAEDAACPTGAAAAWNAGARGCS